MAGMRVHELAKEFDMTSKELLARLTDMKIPAKSHASILQDAYVEKIRKNLEPRSSSVQVSLRKKKPRSWLKSKRKKRLRRPKKLRLVVRQWRKSAHSATPSVLAVKASRRKASLVVRRRKMATRSRPRKPLHRHSRSLASQIERERERVEREAHEARMKAEAETRAAEVAKKQAVAEALQSRMNKSSKSSKSEKKAAPVSAGSSFSSLLDQINNERERLNNQANEKQNQGGSRRGEKGKKRKGFEPSVPELEVQETKGEDRYAQMAFRQRSSSAIRCSLKRALLLRLLPMKARAGARSARKSAKRRHVSVLSSKHWRRVSTQRSCSTIQWSRLRKAPRSLNSPNCSKSLLTTSSSACSCWVRHSRSPRP